METIGELDSRLTELRPALQDQEQPAEQEEERPNHIESFCIFQGFSLQFNPLYMKAVQFDRLFILLFNFLSIFYYSYFIILIKVFFFPSLLALNGCFSKNFNCRSRMVHFLLKTTVRVLSLVSAVFLLFAQR